MPDKDGWQFVEYDYNHIYALCQLCAYRHDNPMFMPCYDCSAIKKSDSHLYFRPASAGKQDRKEGDSLASLDAEKQEKYIQETIDNAWLLESRHGAKYALCFAEEYPSQMGHALLEKFPGLSYVAIVNLKAGTVSLRSRQNSYDVSGLVKEYGGSGHQAAAGFQLNRDHIKAINDQILHKHARHDCSDCVFGMDSAESESEKVAL